MSTQAQKADAFRALHERAGAFIIPNPRDAGTAKLRASPGLAAVETAHALPFRFVLTARAENMIQGRLDLDDTIKRLQAFEEAGADVLYAPGLRDLATIRTVVASVGKPVNVVMTHGDPSLTLAQLAGAGVKRVSVGGSLSRLALAAFLRGAREMADHGGFTWMRETVPSRELKAIFK